MPRLVCADVLKLFEVALVEYPSVDQIILLVNDTRFGGSGNSGGRVAVTSAFFPEIALHEMGHSLADLADEYVDPLIIESSGLPAFEQGRYGNVSVSSDPALVPWAHWIDSDEVLPQFDGDSGIGVFEGGLYRSTGVFRPSFDSRMRSFDVPFGPVNSEQWILRLYALTDGVRKLSPIVTELQLANGEQQLFEVDPIFGVDVQNISWVLNGELLESNGESELLLPSLGSITGQADDDPGVAFNLESSVAIEALADEYLSRVMLTLPTGEHELSVTVTDRSGKIRMDPPHAGIFTWTWSIRVL